MAESTIQKKMSSLSSLSIRHKSSALLNNGSGTGSSSASGHQHHPSTGSASQLLPSNGSTYARSISEEEPPMAYEPALPASSSSSSLANPANPPSSLNPSSATPPPNSSLPPGQASSSSAQQSASSAANSGASTTTTTTTTTNTVESLLALAHKRITTLVYLKKVHEGKVHWFNTILLSRPELEKWFEHQRMVTRTTKFAILGMSLSSLLDINNLQDFLKAMINLLHEFECIPNDNFKPKISSLSRGIFKQSAKSARKSAGGTDYSITLQDSGDPSFIYTPNIPFDLDYFEVWITLSDMLVEVYQKMIKFIDLSGGSSGSLGTTTGGGSGGTTTGVPTPPSAGAAPPLSTTLAGPGAASIAVPLPPTRSSSNYSIVSVHQTHLTSAHIELVSRIDAKLKKADRGVDEGDRRDGPGGDPGRAGPAGPDAPVRRRRPLAFLVRLPARQQPRPAHPALAPPQRLPPPTPPNPHALRIQRLHSPEP
ncbi:hypothetical protein PTTG_28005 [Puccinia triticina 1-1 BBBD Race 1]|uniref:Uncharacterized protein n=1 Tax=Puccinia triticina (isolate 1-1 / race 1 (BBBD)) TaxID=630390 RepID=A0A180GGA4_PUCT1|nr:hypothetical protein PTTG_28005 [Puccinia triticina 1-1 BBBD Race 1]